MSDSDFSTFHKQLKNQPTYVILGVQGSGTNFLSQILTRSLQFSVVIDRSLIFNAAARVARNPTRGSAEAEAKRVIHSLFPDPLRKRLLSKRYFRQNQNYLGIEKHLGELSSDSPSDFADFFYGYHAYRTGGRQKAIKSDDIWENISLLDRIIPNGRILLLVRDPRDNALSIVNKNFGPCEIYHSSLYVNSQLDIYSRFLDSHAGRIHCVKYEDLLSDPVHCVQAIAEFVGEEFNEDVVKRVEEQNIKRNNSEKWRNLAQFDLQAIESVLQSHLEKFGYERTTEGKASPSFFDKMRRFSLDRLRRVPQKLGVKAQRLIHG